MTGPNSGVEALRDLGLMGYRFTVNGATIKARYEGHGAPDPAQVRSLMDLVKEHKPEAIGYLVRKPQTPGRVTCFECGYFRPAGSSQNQTQAWGQCEKRNKGRFGVATVCGVMAEASPGSQEGSSECQAPEGDDTFDLYISQALDQNSSHHQDSCRILSPPVGLPKEGQHLVRIIKVRAYLHNFEEYTGPRARLWMEILEGFDAGKIVVDNISLPHPQESEGRLKRRLLIAYRLGLISKTDQGIKNIDWKTLEGVSCLVDVAHQEFKGRLFPMVTNYQLAPTPRSVD